MCLPTGHLLWLLGTHACLGSHLLHLSLLARHPGLHTALGRRLLHRLHPTLWRLLELLAALLGPSVTGLRWLALPLGMLALPLWWLSPWRL